MARLLTVLVLVMLPLVAAAQESEQTETAASSEIELQQLSFGDFGFAIALPSDGVLFTQETEGWDQDPEVALEWQGGENSPIALIQVRVDSFGAELDEGSFELFCSALLANWEEDEEHFEIITRNEPFELNELSWNLIEVADSSDPDGVMVYYSVFSALAGDSIYTISFYYLSQIDDDVRAFGSPTLKSFRLLD